MFSAGLLRCGICGANFTVSGTQQKYVCASHTNGGRHGCSNDLRVSRTLVEDLLLQAIRRDLLAEEYLEEFISDAHRLLGERQAALDSGHARRAARVVSVRSEVSNLVEATVPESRRRPGQCAKW